MTNMMSVILCSLIVFVLIFCLIKIKLNYNKKNLFEKRNFAQITERNNLIVTEKEKQISKLHEMLAKESEVKASLNKRVIELENSIQTGTGISLRTEVTRIELKFSREELSIMHSGIYSLMPSCKVLSDLKFYIALIEKLQEMIIKTSEGISGYSGINYFYDLMANKNPKE